ncbi:glycosyltransferase [Bacteroidota bacterium]|nr:glycosyltransferase [Bacteroidota bacterium]
MKILILYYEISNYNISCFKELSKKNDLYLVKYDTNKIQAPFQFDFNFPITKYNFKEFNFKKLNKLCNHINPDLILCAGWINKDYLRLCVKNKNSLKVLGFDTPLKSTLKQYIKSFIFKMIYKNSFNYAFVPGFDQALLAIKMGFNKNEIIDGAYSCDYDYFNKIGSIANKLKKINLPRRFLFVGRYVERKGLLDLWESFIQLQEESPNDWELWCIGTGHLYKNRIIHPKIKHFGFVQPNNLSSIVSATSVFVLPSHYEPWGVVVHEFASAGYPLILSDKVLSGNSFLKNEVNGFSFKSRNTRNLKDVLQKIISTKDDELLQMGKISIKLASKLTPKIWAKKLTSLK